MTILDGNAAIQWMREHTTNVPGMCLNTVWQAYGSHDSIGTFAGQYPDALSGWNHAELKHSQDWNPPAGYPVYFGVSPTRTDNNRAAGDVVLSLGGGYVIGTDVGASGHIGVTTIATRAAAISRPYLGWCEDFLGYQINTGSIIASTGGDPITTKRKGKKMNFWRDTSGTIFYGAYPIPNMQRYDLLVRYDKSTPDKQDTFNPAERDMIIVALRANGMHV